MRQQTVWPTHVGRHLEAFLEERGVSTGQFAGRSGITLGHVTDLIKGECILTADVALLLGEFFEMSPLFWLELQRQCCLEARDRSEAEVTVMA